jgi:hypothetical protein
MDAHTEHGSDRVVKVCEACGSEYGPKYGVKQFEQARACSLGCATALGQKNRNWLPLAERFWQKVERSECECWEWTAYRDRAGYGSFRVGGKIHKAHRVSFMLSHGSVPSDRMIRHDCDNPSCVNPDHLRVGEHIDNMRDMVERGRGAAPAGTRHHSNILSEAQVLAIRADARKHADVAADYGVSKSTVTAIKAGRIWKHLK